MHCSGADDFLLAPNSGPRRVDIRQGRISICTVNGYSNGYKRYYIITYRPQTISNDIWHVYVWRLGTELWLKNGISFNDVGKMTLAATPTWPWPARYVLKQGNLPLMLKDSHDDPPPTNGSAPRGGWTCDRPKKVKVPLSPLLTYRLSRFFITVI